MSMYIGILWNRQNSPLAGTCEQWVDVGGKQLNIFSFDGAVNINWGDESPGSKVLAYSILINELYPKIGARAAEEQAAPLVANFVSDFISRLPYPVEIPPGSPFPQWTRTSEVIYQWLRDHHPRVGALFQ